MVHLFSNLHYLFDVAHIFDSETSAFQYFNWKMFNDKNRWFWVARNINKTTINVAGKLSCDKGTPIYASPEQLMN